MGARGSGEADSAHGWRPPPLGRRGSSSADQGVERVVRVGLKLCAPVVLPLRPATAEHAAGPLRAAGLPPRSPCDHPRPRRGPLREPAGRDVRPERRLGDRPTDQPGRWPIPLATVVLAFGWILTLLPVKSEVPSAGLVGGTSPPVPLPRRPTPWPSAPRRLLLRDQPHSSPLCPRRSRPQGL